VAAARSVAPDGLKTKQQEANALNEITSLMRAKEITSQNISMVWDGQTRQSYQRSIKTI
jgi:hypothetical protein